MRCMRYSVLALLLLSAVRPVHAQCADGTQRRPDGWCPGDPQPRPPQPLDSNRWLVLPFANRTAHTGNAWLNQGTASLVQFEMERWPELSVVDEGEVADYLRARGLSGRRLTTTEARTAARHFGAGNLVMGEVTPGPHSVRVLAHLYSTRTGQRVRSGTVVTPETDSAFTSSMGGVVDGLLNLPRDPELRGPAVGTQSLDAYREFVLGREHTRRLEYDSARAHYDAAIARDTAFALAYYAAFINGFNQGASAGQGARRLALGAFRNSSRLALPLRRKITAAEAMSRQAYGEACRQYRDLIRADSSDTDYIIGACFSCCCDALVEPDPRSPSGYSFRTSFQTDLWGLRRALDVDSTLEWPYQSVTTLLAINPLRLGCLGQETEVNCPVDRQMTAYVMLDHDTVSTVPWPVGGFNRGRPVGDTTSAATRMRQTREKLDLARPLVERWRSVNPESRLQRIQYTNVAQASGRPEVALAVVRDFTSPRRENLGGQIQHAFQVLLQMERPQEFVALFDSLRHVERAAEARGDSTLARALRRELTLPSAVSGRIPTLGPETGPERTRREREDAELTRREFGLGPDSLLGFEGDSGRQHILYPSERGPDGRPNAEGEGAFARYRLLYSMLGFHDRRTLLLADTAPRLLWWVRALPNRRLQHDSVSRPPLHLFQVRLATGNAAGARALLGQMDYQLFLGEPSTPMLSDYHLWAAESYLELGDSATALERFRDFATKLPRGQLGRSAVNGYMAVYFLPRFWLRYGDLAYAMRQRDEAIRAYRFIEGVWADADPVFQPTVQRVRVRLAELAGRAN